MGGARAPNGAQAVRACARTDARAAGSGRRREGLAMRKSSRRLRSAFPMWGTVRSRWRRDSGALCAPERGTNSLPSDSAVSSAPFAAANPLARRARGFFAPSARSAGTESPQAAAPASIYIFSLLHIRTNVLMLNLHKTYAEISLFYLNLCGNIFVAFGTLWWYN